MDRYIIKKEDGKFKVVDTQSETEIVPDCGQDMADYHAYLIGKSRFVQAQELLVEIANEGKPMTALKQSVDEQRAKNAHHS